MKQTMCVLPVRCRGCGVFFDLWHELREQETMTTLKEQGEIQKVVNQLFCWHCRKAVSSELEAAEESDEEADSSSDEQQELVESELNLSLAY